MTLILTFLGKGGVGRTTSAIASAQKLAAAGRRVLLFSQEAGPGLSLLLGQAVGPAPTAVTAGNQSFSAVQLQTTQLVNENWEKLKAFEAQYLRDPFFRDVYGQELSILPGMDDLLALNLLRDYTESQQYDVIIHDAAGDQSTLRMWGAIESADWYFRRFKQVLQSSQFYRSLSPFITPVTGAVLSSGISGDVWNQPETQSIEAMVAKGKAMVKDPMQLRAYVVTRDEPLSIATGRYLWSAAQQIGLTVAGAWITPTDASSNAQDEVSKAFAPLPVTTLPVCQPVGHPNGTPANVWQPIVKALPPLTDPVDVPSPMTVDLASASVKLFLPGFEKSEVKLTQYGPEVTVEAGDQRHNVALPPALKGKQVTGAKFQTGYLVISFG